MGQKGEHLESYDLIRDSQHRFTQNKSCLTNQIYRGSDRKNRQRLSHGHKESF